MEQIPTYSTENRMDEEMKREIFAKDIKKGYDNLINKDLKKNKF